jgi:hypothetical protein
MVHQPNPACPPPPPSAHKQHQPFSHTAETTVTTCQGCAKNHVGIQGPSTRRSILHAVHIPGGSKVHVKVRGGATDGLPVSHAPREGIGRPGGATVRHRTFASRGQQIVPRHGDGACRWRTHTTQHNTTQHQLLRGTHTSRKYVPFFQLNCHLVTSILTRTPTHIHTHTPHKSH